ncbi:preprotein translocase subunit [Paramyrothecium foliicola]|nr:preprotein translocase subunit [Paramyrothecium foliicola]
MASDDLSNPLAESGITMHSDSEQYSAGEEQLTSPPSSGSPVILYKPPTVWSLVRGAAINLLLPFINGMMLGFGELFAHEAAFRLGWGGTKVFPLSRRRAHAIGPGIEVQERRPRPSTTLDDLASVIQDHQNCGSDIYPPGSGAVHSKKNPKHTSAPYLHPSRTSLNVAAMIPSRGIARSLPSAGLRRHLSTRSAIQSTAASRISNGGRLGASLRSAGSLSTGSPLRTNYVAAPMVLGTIASSRAFSLWGSSKPSTPAETKSVAEAPVEAAAAPAPAATPAPTPAPEAVSTPAANDLGVTASEVDLASLERVVNGEDILNMPEQIGYLHALGLDYGLGPTALMQWVLEHVHVWSGMGWAASIVATAVLLRTVMFYPQIKAQQFNAKMAEMRKDPRSEEAMKFVRESLAKNDPEMRQKGQFLNTMLRKEYGISYAEMLWGIGQVPFSFGLFRAVSGLASLPVPSLEATSFYWIPNLAASDPYYILPALGTTLMIGSLTVATKFQTPEQRRMTKNLSYVIGAVGFVATCYFSAAVNLMAAGLGGCTLLSAIILNTAFVRRSLGLPTEPPTGAKKKQQPVAGNYEAPRSNTVTASGLEGLTQRLTNRADEVKKGFSESISNYTGTYAGTEQDRAEQKRKDMIKKLEEMRRTQEREEFENKYKRKN